MNYSKGLIDRTKELLDFKTQAEMADYFKVTRKQVSEWRVGNATPPYTKLIKIAKEHNVNLNWFFFGIGKKYLTSAEMTQLHEENINNNNQLLILKDDLSNYEKQIVETIIECIPFVPRAFFDKIIERFLTYKKQFNENGLDDLN